MSNEQRFVVKHGLQSQNIEFVSPDKSKRISVSLLDSDTLSFSGDSGQLFSITDTMSGTIFAVNDISGVPSIEVDDNGTIRLAETFGNILIGTAIDDGLNKLQVNGSIIGTVLKSTVAIGTAPLTVTSTTRVSNLNVATAGTADVLTTARTINGVSFNGSANITITSNTTNTLTIGTGLSGTSFNGSAAVTIAIDSTVATLTGSQVLTNKTISGATNTLSNIANASLTNSSVTVGTTAIALGASSTTLVGLTSVTSTTFVGALTGNASTATTLQTARTINGTSFNGSADITITAANPNALTIGTGLSGTSYTGSAAVTIALATGYGDTLNPYASKTANFVLAAPNGTAGVPTFRAIVAADIPTLNQNTTGTAANVTGIVAVANGGTGVTTSTGTGSVVLSASPTFTGTIAAANLTLSGDLTINGTTTTINSTTLSVDDKNIELGSVASPTNATADGGGITLKGATDKTFNWVNATGAWTSSENIALAAGKDIILNGLTSGSVTLIVPDVSGTNTVTIPAITGTVVTTGDTGTVTNTMLAGSIANAKLVNSSVTVGTTAIALGASSTTLAGLTSIAFVADGSDGASISTTVVGATTYLDFNLNDDNASEAWRWRFTPSGSTVYDAMSLTPSANGISNLIVAGSLLPAAGTAALPAFSTSGDTNTGIFFPAADTIALSSAGTERMRIDASGNVGIGISPPAGSAGRALYISGQQGGYAALSLGASGGEYGRVGYGFTITSTSGAYNYSITDFSSAVGFASGGMQFYTAPSGTAGAAITFTQRMTLDSSGRLLLGATAASGANLLQVNSDALVNGLTIGRGLAAVSTNTAVGVTALAANTTGNSNVAVGHEALFSNTTGVANTATGLSALRANTGGTANTATGRNALLANTTGLGNTATGLGALVANTTGSYNTCIGHDAGQALTTGSNNTIIGRIAGTAGLADTVIIGAGTTERLRIDSTGNVGIGTSTPGYKLEVNGSFAATTKSFLINHPTKEGMKLRYGSLESPYHGIRLTGKAEVINGICVVELPDYIRGLCKQEGSQVQITNIRHGKVLWVDSVDIDNNEFTIATEETGNYKFYWSFTAIRKDVEDMIVEFEE